MSLPLRLIRARRSRSALVRRAALEALAVYGMDWPASVEIGSGLVLQHRALNSIVHPFVRIGDDVMIYQGVTLGDATPWVDRPDDHRPRVIVEDDVVLCAGAVVVGSPGSPTVLGRGTVVGANAVVTRSTGPGEVWAGVPARCVGRRDAVEARARAVDGHDAAAVAAVPAPRQEDREPSPSR